MMEVQGDAYLIVLEHNLGPSVREEVLQLQQLVFAILDSQVHHVQALYVEMDLLLGLKFVMTEVLEDVCLIVQEFKQTTLVLQVAT